MAVSGQHKTGDYLISAEALPVEGGHVAAFKIDRISGGVQPVPFEVHRLTQLAGVYPNAGTAISAGLQWGSDLVRDRPHELSE